MTEKKTLYQRYRPKELSEVIGQDEAVKVLESKLKSESLPNAILLTGMTGCGKTSTARILRKRLGCGKSDYQEINAAESRGIDTIREISQAMHLQPMSGKCKVWVLDEAGKITGDGQTCLLKVLEDGPSHAYFFLCTTDPQKLLPTIRNRCMEVKLKPIAVGRLDDLLNKICDKEKLLADAVSRQCLTKIAEAADGSARKALMLLEQVLAIEDEKEQLACIEKGDVQKQSIDLCRALMDKRTKWADVAKILQGLEGEEPESIRRAVLGYANAVLLKTDNPLAYLVLSVMQFDLFASGRPGLTRACKEIYNSEKK